MHGSYYARALALAHLAMAHMFGVVATEGRAARHRAILLGRRRAFLMASPASRKEAQQAPAQGEAHYPQQDAAVTNKLMAAVK